MRQPCFTTKVGQNYQSGTLFSWQLTDSSVDRSAKHEFRNLNLNNVKINLKYNFLILKLPKPN